MARLTDWSSQVSFERNELTGKTGSKIEAGQEPNTLTLLNTDNDTIGDFYSRRLPKIGAK